jgi:hypothetical protein
VLKTPRIRRIFVRDLTHETEGNAIGIGVADVTTWRLVKKINYAAMYLNAVTGESPELGKVPMAFDSDRDAIEAALKMVGLTLPQRARVVWIKNTLHLTEMYASETMLPEVEKNPLLTVVHDATSFLFDKAGNLGVF